MSHLGCESVKDSESHTNTTAVTERELGIQGLAGMSLCEGRLCQNARELRTPNIER